MLGPLENSKIDADSIRKKTDDIEKRVSDLSSILDNIKEKSSQISEIFELLKIINNKNNLLALNSYIEASRLGDNRKGFLIVSEKMQQIVKNSTESTNKGSILSDELLEEIEKMDTELKALKEKY